MEKKISQMRDILDIELGAWKMYFDRAINQYGKGIGVLLITPNGSHVPLAVKLNFEATNNMAEQEAYIAGMEALRELGVKEAEVFGDSTLVIAQAQKLQKVKEKHLKPYQQYLDDLIKTFERIEHTIILKAQNKFANALATLASIVEIPERVWTQPSEIEQSYELAHNGKTKSSVLVSMPGLSRQRKNLRRCAFVRLLTVVTTPARARPIGGLPR